MGIVSAIIATFVRSLSGIGLPSCVEDIAVAWYKDLTSKNKTCDDGGNEVYCIDDAIGERDDVVFFGQYLSSGTINFGTGRVGTFDFTDPSTGNAVTGVAMSTSYAVPANGICDIITSDGSENPCCEQAGTVLHDVENGYHISVTTPVWAETLYGSDYLNQEGYADKTHSDAEAYDWTTDVFTVPIALDNSTLIPLKKKNSLESSALDAPLNMIL